MKKSNHLLLLLLIAAACTSSPTMNPQSEQPSATVTLAASRSSPSVTPMVPIGTLPATPTSTGVPDSQARIVFAGRTLGFRNSNLFTINADGSDFAKITDNWNLYTDYTAAVWAPDGNQIAFVLAEQGQDTEIAVINRDGSGLRRLTDNAVDDWAPTWSPDGESIAFTSRQNSPRTKVYTMHRDGSDFQRVTLESDYVEQSPDWSPTGGQIVFVARGPEAGTENGHLRVVNVDGSGERRLTPGSFNIDDPRWSPDGNWIAYTIHQGGIWFNFVSANGTQLLEPRAEGVQDFLYPVWSPDAERVAFAVVEESSPNVTSLAVMEVDTLKWWKLVDGVNAWARCWLPDGHRIMYRRNDELWVINDDGSHADFVASGMGMSDCYPHYSRQ